MPTSGTFTFNLDLAEVAEEAFERCGLELRTGFDYRTARRSMNLLMLEWQNRGTNIFTIRETSQALVAGTYDYVLSNEKLEVIEAVYRKNSGAENQHDKTLRRISLSEYSHKSNKLLQSEPNVFAIEKTAAGLTMKLWPVPDAAETVSYWYLEQIEDAGIPASNNMDIPPRFLPALVTGLAYQIALKRPTDVPVQRVISLEAEYNKQYNLATEGERERASLFMRPPVSYT
jgi:hypothetical protein